MRMRMRSREAGKPESPAGHCDRQHDQRHPRLPPSIMVPVATQPYNNDFDTTRECDVSYASQQRGVLEPFSKHGPVTFTISKICFRVISSLVWDIVPS